MAKLKDTADAWEDRTLGASLEHVVVAGPEHELALDEALELRSISIRLPLQLINQYKLIGHFHGKGYQPLMRDVLARFVPSALREILEAEALKAEKAKEQAEAPPPPMKKAA